MGCPPRRRFCLRPQLLGWICALLFSSGASSSFAADREPLTAIVITARSALPDDNFADAAVLVLNNLGPAPIGIITNRPTKYPVASLFPHLEQQLAQAHDKIYF